MSTFSSLKKLQLNILKNKLKKLLHLTVDLKYIKNIFDCVVDNANLIKGLVKQWIVDNHFSCLLPMQNQDTHKQCHLFPFEKYWYSAYFLQLFPLPSFAVFDAGSDIIEHCVPNIEEHESMKSSEDILRLFFQNPYIITCQLEIYNKLRIQEEQILLEKLRQIYQNDPIT
ncbi:hypothetical protein BpHYR1_009431 [Brachionus plicatilis]|uniref:Uncharacterized protein n=1 Tax=Brachionus plicatilis TaxID=10195 RepID=A0A3M7R5I2_BRAPC|nr:hypothetical protein BpHYR1_009431 [Brachionus plicatilis]